MGTSRRPPAIDPLGARKHLSLTHIGSPSEIPQPESPGAALDSLSPEALGGAEIPSPVSRPDAHRSTRNPKPMSRSPLQAAQRGRRLPTGSPATRNRSLDLPCRPLEVVDDARRFARNPKPIDLSGI
jgi:hypothetical protein